MKQAINDITIIRNLPQLLESKNDYLLLNDIPECFHEDFKHFIIGITVHFDSNKNLIIGKNIYKKWIHKLWTKGLDYDISFGTSK